MARQKGSVTIYLLLSLLLTTGLVFTLTESARISCIQARVRGVTFMALDSCFAEFSREIFDEYGIMALWKSEEEFTNDLNGYIRNNLDFSDLDLYRDADLYLLRHNASAIGEIVHLTDDNGNVFLDQVTEYMQYYVVEEALSALLSQLSLFGEGEKIAEFVEKINQYRDIFVKVADTISSIQKACDNAKSVVNNPKTILGNMRRSMKRYEETGNMIYIAQFNTNFWNLESGRDELNGYMQIIQAETQNYYGYAQSAGAAINSLREELETDGEAYSGETLEAIHQELDRLELKTTDTQEDFYGIQENAVTAALYQGELEALDPIIRDIDPQEMRYHILEYQSEVDYYESLFSDFQVDGLGLNVDAEPVQREDPGFLATVGDIFSKGLVKAIAGNDISNAKADTSSFPSKTAGRNGSGESGSFLSASYKQLLLGEYALKHFGNYLDEKEETALKYEVEYMIGGKASDRDNLHDVIRKIVLLRSGLNMVSMFRDPEKIEEAYALALAIIGFTGIEPLVETLKMLIVSVWCLAESLCDARAILSGGKVPLIKEPYEWTVSAIGLKNFSKTVLPSASDERGMEYEDYLWVLLLAEQTPVVTYRVMDLIQANACLRYQPEFRMAECIDRVKMEVNYDTRQLFTAFRFAGTLLGGQQGGYSFSVTQQYSY